MASTVYSLFRDTMIQKLNQFKFCRIVVSLELLLHKPDGTEVVWKKNLGRRDVSNIKELPVEFIKIDLPSAIRATKGVVNIQNDDNFCFFYSILARRHRSYRNPQRVT